LYRADDIARWRAQREALSVDSTAVEHHPTTDRYSVPRDDAAIVYDDVAIYDVGISVEPAENVQRTLGDRNRPSYRGRGRHSARPDSEAIGRREPVSLGSRAKLLDPLPNAIRERLSLGGARVGRHRARRGALRVRDRYPKADERERDGKECHGRASWSCRHAYARLRLEARAILRRPNVVAPAVARNPPNNSNRPTVPAWLIRASVCEPNKARSASREPSTTSSRNRLPAMPVPKTSRSVWDATHMIAIVSMLATVVANPRATARAGRESGTH